MSSSISSSDLPRFGSLALTVSGALVSFLLVASTIIGINAWVDPFDSGLSPVRKEVNRTASFRAKNVAQWAAFDIAELPEEAFSSAEIVLIGDSRMRLLSGGAYSARSYELDGKPLLDLSFGGASIQESIDVFEKHRQRFSSLELVVVSAPYDRMVDSAATADRVEEAHRHARFPILYFLNTNTLRYSFTELFAPPTPQPDRSYTRPALGEAHLDCKQGHKPVDGELRVRNRHRRANVQLSLPEAENTFDTQVAPFLESLDRAGVGHVLFVPPNSPRIEAFLTDDLSWRFGNYIERAEAASDVVRIDPDTLASVVWQDDWHVCIDSGAFLMDRLWPQLAQAAAGR